MQWVEVRQVRTRILIHAFSLVTKYRNIHKICLPREEHKEHLNLSVHGSYGGLVMQANPAMQPITVTETQDPNNETKYMSLIWMFVHSNSVKRVHHGLLLLVYKTKSTINIKSSKGPHSQGLSKSQSCFQVPLQT